MSDHKPPPPPTTKPLTPPSTSKPTTPTLSRRNSLRPAGGPLTPSPSSKPTTPALSRRNSFRPPGGQLPTTTTTSTWRPPRPQTPLPTPSKSASNGSRSPIYPRPPLTLSICVHTSLTHLSHYRNTPIRPGTRYRCCCSTHTLRKAISQSSFKYIDGAGGQTVYAAAPARALWCYCAGGEGHVVSSAGEAVERHLALERERSREENGDGVGRVGNEKGEEAKRDWIARVEEEVSGNGNGSRNGDGNGSGNATGSGILERLSEGQQRVSEVQQRELQTVEWGGTEKALKRQRDFVWLGDKVGRCCRRLGCPWLCKRGESV